MSKNLVIVESPAKARTVGRYLGGDYTVLASLGHVRDLPPGGLGVDVERDFEPKYEVMKAALLTVVPADDAGFPFQDLADAVRPHLPTELFANASVSWYVVTVKLDLEARGLIERVPGSRPQRVRRVS